MLGLAHVFSRRDAPLTGEEVEKIQGVKRVREDVNRLWDFPIYEVTLERSVFEVRAMTGEDARRRISHAAWLSIPAVWTHPWVGDDLAKARQFIVFRSDDHVEYDLRVLAGGVGDAVDGTVEVGGRYTKGWDVLARPRRPERKEPLAPHARQVAQRALILAAVRKKASAIWKGDPDAGGLMALRMCEWLDTGILREELSEEEHDFLGALPVGLGFHAYVRAEERYEGLPILLWALGLAPLARHAEPAAESLTDGLGLFEDLPAIIKHAKLRPEEEIARLRIAMEDYDRNVAQSDRERRRGLGETLDERRIHAERRRALRWLLGVAPSYEDASSDAFARAVEG